MQYLNTLNRELFVTCQTVSRFLAVVKDGPPTAEIGHWTDRRLLVIFLLRPYMT